MPSFFIVLDSFKEKYEHALRRDDVKAIVITGKLKLFISLSCEEYEMLTDASTLKIELIEQVQMANFLGASMLVHLTEGERV